MWQLVKDNKIVIKSQGIIIDRKRLAADQSLAELVMNDEDLKAKYGHNFKQVGGTEKSGGVTIPVTLKKKAEAIKSQSETSQESVSTSSQVQTSETQKPAQPDGMSLNVSEVKPESQLKDSQQSRQGTGNRRERRELHFKTQR